MAEICIPTDRVPADILHRLKAIGQLLQSETSCASQAVGQSSSSSSAVMREKDNNTYDEVDGSLEVDRTGRRVETRVSSGTKDKGDVVSALTRTSPEKQVEQGERSSTQDIRQDMFVLQQQQQALHQLHQSQTNLRQHQTHGAKRVSTFSSHVDDGVIDDTRLDPSCQRSRSPSQGEVGAQDILRQRRTMRSPFVPDSKASFSSGPPGMSRETAHRSASFGQTSAMDDDDDIVRIFPSTSVAAPADVGYQQSPKVLTPPETPESEGKRKVKDVFTFDDLACTEELLRQTMEKMSQLQEQTSQTSPVRREV
ncbi:uncharacterized protein LOC112556768 isoform X2 [Pomacea canaliculata]|nr:uncharacterized protein LOC112556768 isoform X2 [Pomacea canaliculata]